MAVLLQQSHVMPPPPPSEQQQQQEAEQQAKDLLGGEESAPAGEEGAKAPIPMPYAARVEVGFVEPGRTLQIRGTVKEDAHRFEVNLVNGVSNSRQLEYGAIPHQIVFHLCFHFEVGISVFNSYLDGDWGYEECHLNPLFPGHCFDVAIHVTAERYEVAVGGKALATYQHRINPKAIDYIQVKGDVDLETVTWASEPPPHKESGEEEEEIPGAP